MQLLFRILLLLTSFIFGFIAVKNPMAIARVIVMWARFVSKGYKFPIQPKAQQAFDLVDQPYDYARMFSAQLEIIQRAGFVVIFITITSLCIFLIGGMK